MHVSRVDPNRRPIRLRPWRHGRGSSACRRRRGPGKVMPWPPRADCSEPSRSGPGGAVRLNVPMYCQLLAWLGPMFQCNCYRPPVQCFPGSLVGWCLPLRPLLQIPSVKVAQTRDLPDSLLKLVPFSIWRKFSKIGRLFIAFHPLLSVLYNLLTKVSHGLRFKKTNLLLISD